MPLGKAHKRKTNSDKRICMCEGGKSVVCIFNNGHTYDTYAPAHTSLLVLETKNLRIFIYRQISIASPRVEQVCIHARGDPFVSDPRNANNEPRNGSQGRHDARVATVWCSVGISWQTNSSREKKRKVSGKTRQAKIHAKTHPLANPLRR